MLDATPFYAEMGGEVGDTGTIYADGLAADAPATWPHQGQGRPLRARRERRRRARSHAGDERHAPPIDAAAAASASRRNHTATHLLARRAASQVLGDHVKPGGSATSGPDRLRFDFTHFEAVTPDAARPQVEGMVNARDLRRRADRHATSWDLARRRTQRRPAPSALFGEKYGDVVRVVSTVRARPFSRELCGGCHVRNTAEIGSW